MRGWKFWTLLASVFFAGLLTGAASTGLFVKHRIETLSQGPAAEMARPLLRHLDRRLQLSESQRSELEPLVVATARKLRQYRRQHAPGFVAIIREAANSMEPHLEPQQREKLRDMFKNFEKHAVPDKTQDADADNDSNKAAKAQEK